MAEIESLPAHTGPDYRAVGSAERALLVFRWIALASVLVNVLLDYRPTIGRSPELAFAGVLGVAAWTWVLTRREGRVRGWLLIADVAVGVGFMLLSGLVMPPGYIDAGPALLSLTYPFCSVLSAGAAYGPVAGMGAGIVMGAAHLLVRVVNGVPVDTVVLQRAWPTATGFLLLGLLFGVVAMLLRRSSEEAFQATTEAMAAREREARLSERESMAREIHDSVLQVLALIHKRGLQLSQSAVPSPEEVMELAEMARDQEIALRGLILREPDENSEGEASLRTALEAASRGVREVDVSVSAVGPVWLPRPILDELVAAVREALANVVEHAAASKVVIFADEHEGVVQVCIRDDGVGFQFDEARFRSEGKFGVMNSMRGRVEALGGQMKIDSRAGAGTEVEFLVPLPGGRATQ